MEARNSEEKIRFFVNMAHDVRTPITLVKAPLNQIENETLTEDGKSALQLAQRNLDKLFNLISQLLDFQKADNHHISLVIEETLLKKFILNIVSDFELLAKEKQIDLYVNLPVADQKIYIDRKKLSLCIENLLSNAIKYTNAHGKIELKLVVTDDGKLLIEISDDGIGIPTKSHKKLFSRFYRAENASNSKETGSGIGLMLTNKLVALHKGKISFVSVENFGTCFKIEIPYTKNAYNPNEIVEFTESELTDMEEEYSTDDLTNILLVEDNDEIRDFLAKQLRHEYVVSVASNGNEAIDIINQNPPDFILSDIMMPGISGFELCNILKNDINTSHIPIILLSALSDRSDIIKGLHLGADDYITKPFDMSILQSKIKTIVKNRVILKNKIIDKTTDATDSKFINPLDKAFMEKVIQHIEENLLNEEFSIDQLAVEMAKSRSVFFKKLKSITNTSPRDFIKEIRMKKAARLLLEQRYQITEVAYLVGFTNPKHFSTFFKKYYGVSPRRYIDNHLDIQTGV
jgi:DNA-binding response OmpR family regulator/two-component sensor histidine kinase